MIKKAQEVLYWLSHVLVIYGIYKNDLMSVLVGTSIVLEVEIRKLKERA